MGVVRGVAANGCCCPTPDGTVRGAARPEAASCEPDGPRWGRDRGAKRHRCMGNGQLRVARSTGTLRLARCKRAAPGARLGAGVPDLAREPHRWWAGALGRRVQRSAVDGAQARAEAAGSSARAGLGSASSAEVTPRRPAPSLPRGSPRCQTSRGETRVNVAVVRSLRGEECGRRGSPRATPSGDRQGGASGAGCQRGRGVRHLVNLVWTEGRAADRDVGPRARSSE
jgi:hypothetical protein